MKPGVVVYREQRVEEIALGVRTARIKAGWTQEQVAEHLGYSRAHVNRVEQGSAQLKVADLELLSDAFHITLKELLQLNNQEPLASTDEVRVQDRVCYYPVKQV